MDLNKAMTALALACAALAVVATDATARPKHRSLATGATVQGQPTVMGNDGRYQPVTAAAAAQPVGRRAARAARNTRASRNTARSEIGSLPDTTASFSGGSNSLVSEARKYLGGNPTGRRSLWCGAFMDMVLKRTGHPGGGNLARGYARYGTRVSGPQVGAIAVMARRGGGHVGIVTGIDSNGNPIVISGNHNNRVAEVAYPRSRIITYVVP
jgi:uncharacterized protein (TIGR02594 family)